MGAVNLHDTRNILVHATQGTLSVKDVSSFGAFVNSNKIHEYARNKGKQSDHIRLARRSI